jgi:hypothetical protein
MIHIKSFIALIILFTINVIDVCFAENNDDNIQTLEILGSKDACLNKTYTYMVTSIAGTKYEWSVSKGKFVGLSNSSAAQVIWASSGIGYIKVVTTSSAGIKDSLTMNVNILAKNVMEILGNNYPCQSSITKYYADNPNKYSLQWRVGNGTIVNGGIKDTVEVLWTYSGNGSVTLFSTNPLGCSDTNTISVAITKMPIPTITGSTNVCSSVECEYKTDYSSTTLYKWSANKGVVVGADYYPTVQIRWDSAGQGQIYLTTTSSSNVCTSSNSKIVSVIQRPNVYLEPFPEKCYSTDDIILSGGTPSGGYYSGTWVQGDKFKTIYAGTGSHLITYTVASENGCTTSYNQLLIINPLPSKPTIVKLDTLLRSTTKYGNQWFYNGQIMIDDTTQFITPKLNGYYTVQVTSDKGCVSLMSDTLNYKYLYVDNSDLNSEVSASFRGSELIIQAKEQINSIRISNYMGQLIIEQNRDNCNSLNVIELKGLNMGTYILQVVTDKNVYNKKLLLNQ